MKNLLKTALIFLLAINNSFAQQEKGIIGYDNWLDSWTEFRPSRIDYGEATEILSGNISDSITLTKRNTYLLLGDVFVTDNATLTIEPGTVILGDFKTKGSLTISKGAKIIAEGKQTDPIIFTSNRSVKKPGDWGGLFILGDAPINTYGNQSSLNYGLRPSNFESISYGGDDPESDSGILKYVRIEFAGKKTKATGNMNGLTLAGVGNKTVVENVMVSYSEGNAINVRGGDLSMTQMVAYKNSKNDYEFKYKHYLNQQVKIEVPEGFDVSYIPPSIEEKHPNFSFKVSFEQEGNYIMYHKEISIPAARVKKEDMELWNSCIEKLQDTYKEQLAFKKQK